MSEHYCKQCEELEISQTEKQWTDPLLLLALKKKQRKIEACLVHRKTKTDFERTFEQYYQEESEIEKWTRKKAYFATIVLIINIYSLFYIFSKYIQEKNGLVGYAEKLPAIFYITILISAISGVALIIILLTINSRLLKHATLLIISEAIMMVSAIMQLLWFGVAISIGYFVWVFSSITNPEPHDLNKKLESGTEEKKEVARATSKKTRLSLKLIIAATILSIVYTILWALHVLDPFFDLLKAHNLWWW